jgi:NodT family efflux transporter outer membrane factor (OMF) lipoprotein
VTLPRLTIAALLATLAACAAGPDFRRPAAPGAGDYGAASAPGGTASASVPVGDAQRFVRDMDVPAEWWTLFGSAKLTHLVEESLRANPDLAAAEAALRQAHELYLAQKASFLPSVGGTAGGNRNQNPGNTLTNPTISTNPSYSLYTAQLSLSFSPDVFGVTRRTVEAAKAAEDETRFEREATYVTLTTNVVVTAVAEASLRGQIAATERLLAIQNRLTEIVRQRRALGTASELDAFAQAAAEAQVAATLPPLQKQLGQARDALAALLGRLPSDEPADTFRLEDLALPTDLPVSLPARLVEQRPDVRQAEENLHAASAELGVAVGSMLPQISIDAGLGSTALQLGKLFSAYTGFWQYGGSLTQTLFDAGALLHRHRAAEAALDQAGAQYRAAVILAFQNVADTLRALEADADALKAAAAGAEASRATCDLADRQFALGTISLVDSMAAEQAYRQAELLLVQAEASRLADTAGLFQALGGGWWNRSSGGRP